MIPTGRTLPGLNHASGVRHQADVAWPQRHMIWYVADNLMPLNREFRGILLLNIFSTRIIGYWWLLYILFPPAILNCIANYSRLYCISSYTADYITCTQTSARTHASYESYTMNAYTSSFASSCPFKSYYLNIYQLVLSASKFKECPCRSSSKCWNWGQVARVRP